MTILITGIHGFVGSNLVEALKENHKIYGLDIISSEKEGIIKTYSWDELDLLPDVDTIIHLAGKAHDTKSYGRRPVSTASLASSATTIEYFNINTGLTQTIFDYFLQSNARQFIFFSSVKAAADRVEGDYLTEDVIPKPVGTYGESKIKAEEYINSQLSIVNSQLKTIYIFRPCMIHGPGNKGNLNLLYQFVNKGIPYPLGAFENRRSFLNIRNLSYIVEQFILQNPEQGIYHLSDDEPVSTNELIKLIAQSTGKKERIWRWNKRLIKTVARIGDVCKLPLNSDRLQKLTENYVVSNQKMKTAIGIRRLPVDAKTGLIQTLQTFNHNS